MSEVEVFRLTSFDKNKYYEFALKTRTEGRWPNERHFTTNTLTYVGKHIESKSWGGMSGDGRGGAEVFKDEKGFIHEIEYDYDGKTCFRELE